MLHNHDKFGVGYGDEYEELWYGESVGDREVDDLFFVLVFESIFPRSSGVIGVQPDVDINITNMLIHATTDINPP